jgi:hypothetical protein
LLTAHLARVIFLLDCLEAKQGGHRWTKPQNPRGATRHMLLALKDRQFVELLTLFFAILFCCCTRRHQCQNTISTLSSCGNYLDFNNSTPCRSKPDHLPQI